MNISDINDLFARIKRLSLRLEKKEGAGHKWSYTFPDGLETTYILKNVRCFEEIEDDIANLFIWVWNLKDYLKEFAETIGTDPQEVENLINSDHNLQLCADVANWLKHGRLKSSRSNSYARLGRLRFHAPHGTFSSITFRGTEIEIDVSKVKEILLLMPVLKMNGDEIADSFEVISMALSQWEGYFKKITENS